jgi:hypothetical protein
VRALEIHVEMIAAFRDSIGNQLGVSNLPGMWRRMAMSDARVSNMAAAINAKKSRLPPVSRAQAPAYVLRMAPPRPIPVAAPTPVARALVG